MSERPGIASWILHAYADGELDPQERREVELQLASDPAARAELEAWLAQKAALKTALDPVLSEPIPRSLRAMVRVDGGAAWHRPALLAAGLALILAGAIGGWLVAQIFLPMGMANFVERAIVAHEVFASEAQRPVEITASHREHLVSWLSDRIGVPLKLPDLSSQGYSLLGGRLLVAEDRPAALLMYEDKAKERLAIFLAANTSDEETEFLVTSKGPLTACYWLNEQLAFVITGDVSRDRMMSIASAVYRQVGD